MHRFLLALAFVPLSWLQAQDRPTVHVVATGGTISNTGGGSARRTGDELVDALPNIERYANVTTEQFSNVASGSITPQNWLEIAQRINTVFATRPDVAGVVVTHGTDTIEETAFFLDLTTASCKPVIITGSMRQATAVGADGPANLFNSVRVAASAEARSRGAMLLLNDEIFAARNVSKVNTLRPDAFDSPGIGAEGVVDPDGAIFFHKPDRSDCQPLIDISAVDSFPRVDIIYVYGGADGALIDAAVEAGAKALVVAGAGAGASTPGQSAALNRARQRGVHIIVSSRTGSGRVTNAGSVAGNVTAERGLRLGAGTLNPQKARVLIMLALAAKLSPERIVELFQRP